MLATIITILFVLYAGALTLVATSRAADPVVRNGLRLLILIPVAAVPVARLVGPAPALLVAVCGAGALLGLAVLRSPRVSFPARSLPDGARPERQPSARAPRPEWLARVARVGRRALRSDGAYAAGGTRALRVDVAGLLLGLGLGVILVRALLLLW